MRTVLVEASPRNPATGVVVPTRLAGGGSKPYLWLGFTDWRSGVFDLPRFTAELEFGDAGWTGGAIPQTAAINFASADVTLLSELAGLYWKGAPLTIKVGDDEQDSPTFSLLLTATVAAVEADAGVLTLTIGDLGVKLSKPIAPDKFAGTGGIEGEEAARGRVKRVGYGRLFNVEGFVLDPANCIYEFGDPARPLTQFHSISDRGRFGPIVVLDWQGSIDATLNALKASVPPQGGAVAAPSIACVKWWTVPSGPLTADLGGHFFPGVVGTAPNIANILANLAGLSVSNLPAANAARPAITGIQISDDNETISGAIDRLLRGSSLIWVLDPDGSIRLEEWSLDSSLYSLSWSGTNNSPVGWMPGGQNRVVNSNFSNGLSNWSLVTSEPQLYSWGIDNADFIVPGNQYQGLLFNLRNGDYQAAVVSDWVSVTPGKLVYGSTRMAARECVNRLALQWGDADKAYISPDAATSETVYNDHRGSSDIDSFKLLSVSAIAPQNARYARLAMLKGGWLENPQNDLSWLFFMNPRIASETTPLDWQPSDPGVEEVVSKGVSRLATFAPIKTRKLGYQANNRVMNGGEVSSAILATDTYYPDGTPVSALQPAQQGATSGAPFGTNVGDRSAADVAGTIRPGSGVADDKVSTTAISERAVSRPYFAQLASSVGLPNQQTVSIIAQSVTKDRGDSDMIFDAVIRMQSSDDIRGTFYLYEDAGGTPQTIDQMEVYLNGAGGTFRIAIPVRFREFDRPAGAYHFGIAFTRDGGASAVIAAAGSNFEVVEAKR